MYDTASTTNHDLKYTTIDPDILELITEQNNTIIKQNDELLKYLRKMFPIHNQ